MAQPWMPLYIADYLADTGHLSAAEHGAYLLLIMHYWRTGELPDDDAQLARIARMSPAEWRRSRSSIAAFFSAGWRHKRIDAEMEKASVKHSRRAEAGKRGGNAKASASKTPSNATPVATDLPATVPKQTDSNALASSSQPERKIAAQQVLDTAARAPEPGPPPDEPPVGDQTPIAEPKTLAAATPLGGDPPPDDGPSLDDGVPSFLDRTPRRAELDRIEAECRAAAGLADDPSPSLLDISPIVTMLDTKGYALERDVLPVLRTMAAKGKRGRTWRYYVDAIADAHKANGAIAAKPAAKPVAPTVWLTTEDARWSAAAERYREARGREPAHTAGLGGMGWYFPAEMVV